MAFKLLLCVAAVLGAANAGFVSTPAFGYATVGAPTLSSQSSNTLRTFGNQGQVSHETKSVQTPFSSDTRSDIRVSNDAQILAHSYSPAVATYAAAPAVTSYAAPAYTRTYAAPAVTSYAAPAVHTTYAAAPAVASYAAPAYTRTYAAPAVTSYAAPAVAAYSAAPAYTSYSAGPAYTAYSAPAVTKTISTHAVAAPATQLLGVAYSAAPAVAHMTYSNGLGITYSY